jgi:diaminopimelate decarboxylase
MNDAATLRLLARIAEQYGTPTYAFDKRRLQSQVLKLQQYLPSAVEILYSLKANASLGICDIFAQSGIGADVASAGELATAVAAGFSPDRIFVAGPWKLAETIEQLRDLPEAIVSVDSPSELRMLVDQKIPNRVVIRLRPDFSSAAVVTAGKESRFGFLFDDLDQSYEIVHSGKVDVVGFHIFAGSQVLRAEGIIDHLHRSFDLSRRAAEILDVTPVLLNLGGGFGIPYGQNDPGLELEPVGAELAKLLDLAAPARIVLELGRFLVAEAGWYLTSVVGQQTHQGRPAALVDGGTHQRADMCGLCLRTRANPPLVLGETSLPTIPTDVLGCLSLPADVLAEAALLPPLEPGMVLAFATAGAYGMWSSPSMFHGSPLPAEVAFENDVIYPMRERLPATSILAGQQHVREKRRLGIVSSGRGN